MNNTFVHRKPEATELVPAREVLYHGIPVSPGIAIGLVRKLGYTSELQLSRSPELESIPETAIDSEIQSFQKAVDQTVDDLQSLKEKMIENGEGESTSAEILEAHLLIVQDRVLYLDVINRIRKDHVTAV